MYNKNSLLNFLVKIQKHMKFKLEVLIFFYEIYMILQVYTVFSCILREFNVSPNVGKTSMKQIYIRVHEKTNLVQV